MARIPIWLVLVGVVGLSTVVRAWVGLRVPTPWIAADEIIYAELGRSLWETGRLEILGAETAFYSLVHPALIGLPLAALDTAAGYDVARVLQALAMSLAAVPVFLWGRKLMSERWALVAATLTLTLPAFVYSGLLMTETIFLPAMMLAAWAMASALERPSKRSQALVVATFALALFTRLQALVLVPAFVLALALFALATRSLAPIRRTALATAGIAALGLLWLVSGGFGAYDPARQTSYDLGSALRFGFYHAADALLLVGLAPACALVLLAWHHRRETDAVAAFLAVAAAISLGLVAQVALFASRYVGRLAERDLIALAPLLFLALCLWLDRGAPRTRLSASVVAFVGATIVLFLPYGRLVHKSAIPDAFMLLPLWQLGAYELVAVATGAIVLLVVFLPRLLPLVLAGVFIAVSVDASRFVEREATTLRTSFFGEASPQWVDDFADGEVGYFYDGEPHWNAVWSYVFWNREIRRIYVLAQARRIPGPIPQTRVDPFPLGELSEDAPNYVVSSTAFSFFGRATASVDQVGLVHRGLVLWRTRPPLQLSTMMVGVQSNGDVLGPVSLTAYGCTGGAFELTLVAKGSPVDVRLETATETVERTLAPAEVWEASVPAPVAGVCTLRVTPSGIVGSTRFEYVAG